MPVAELTTQPSEVVHSKSGAASAMAICAKTANVLDPLPQVTAANLEAVVAIPADRQGRAAPRHARQGHWARGVWNRYATARHAVRGDPAIRRCGYQSEQIDDTAAKAVKGVVEIVPLPAGVGVIAENLQAARKAEEALKVRPGRRQPRRPCNNEAILRDYQRTLAAHWNKPGIEMLSKGDVSRPSTVPPRSYDSFCGIYKQFAFYINEYMYLCAGK